MALAVVPVSAPSIGVLLELSAQAQREGADWVEWRIDTCALHGVDPDQVVAAIPRSPLPVLATIRHASERGDWTGSEERRAALLKAADAAGAVAIDCEFAQRAILGTWRPSRAVLILSAHDFIGLEPARHDLIAAMRAAGAQLPKIAVMARDAADLDTVRELLIDRDGDLIVLAMGEHGLPSRLLAGVWGSFLSFARLGDGGGSAPGQPPVAELVGRYRLHAQCPDWPVYGVIGSPIAHSRSPLLHNGALAALGLPGVYVPFRVEDAPAFWAACGDWIAGLSITIPHKQALLSSVEQPDALVRSIGAMNTLWRVEGRTQAANTDAGAIAACVGPVSGKTVLILGAGGVARAAAHALSAAGARIVIANRTRERAEQLAREVGGTVVDEGVPVSYDVLVNGTSVGMGAPNETPWPADFHRPGSLVLDTVYTPKDTRLLREAALRGARTVPGTDLFIGQAAGQFRRFTGVDPDLHLLTRLLG